MASIVPRAVTFVLLLHTVAVAGNEETCEVGFFGQDCSNVCSTNCRPFETYPCEKETGACFQGCKKGLYGPTCNETCACSGTCLQDTGECVNRDEEEDNDKEENCADCECTAWLVVTIILAIACLFCTAGWICVYLRYKWQTTSAKRKYKEQRDSEEVIELKGQSIECSNDTSSEDILKDKIKDKEKEIQQLKDQKNEVEAQLEGKSKILSDLGLANYRFYHLLKTSSPMSYLVNYIELSFDKEKVNLNFTHINANEELCNKKGPKENKWGGSRFSTYQGTCGSVDFHGQGCAQYFELNIDVCIHDALKGKTLLFDVGFVKHDDMDTSKYTSDKNISLKVLHCPEHGRICMVVVKHDSQKYHEYAELENKTGSTKTFKFGILVDDVRKTITYIDVAKFEIISTLSKIDFRNKIRPLFGLFAQSYGDVSMTIVCGSRIDMSPIKMKLIEGSLSCL